VSDQIIEYAKPWERQPGESDKRFEYFQVFLRSNEEKPDSPRSLKKIAEQIGLGYDSVRTYSSDFSWFERATAYDNAMKLREQTEKAEMRRIVQRVEFDTTMYLHGEFMKAFRKSVDIDTKIVAEAVALEAAKEDGVVDYTVTVRLDPASFRGIALTQATFLRELRTAARMPQSYSASHLELSNRSKGQGIEDILLEAGKDETS
jgi:hypothetical protein